MYINIQNHSQDNSFESKLLTVTAVTTVGPGSKV